MRFLKKRNKKSSIGCIVDKQGVKHQSKPEVMDCFNSHFVEVGENMAENNNHENISDLRDPLDFVVNTERSFIKFQKTDQSEIQNLISDLDEKKSSRYDNISNKLIKSTSTIILPYLEKLYKHVSIKIFFLNDLK